MSNQANIGANLHGDDPEARKLAAATMGSARTERKRETARQNVLAAHEARKGAGTSDAQKQAVREYWQNYRAKKAAAAVAAPATISPEPKRRGRPRKTETVENVQQTTDTLQASP